MEQMKKSVSFVKYSQVDAATLPFCIFFEINDTRATTGISRNCESEESTVKISNTD